MSNFFPLAVSEFARGVGRRGSPGSPLCRKRSLVVCSFGLVWFHPRPCPHRFPELFSLNPHTQSLDEVPPWARHVPGGRWRGRGASAGLGASSATGPSKSAWGRQDGTRRLWSWPVPHWPYPPRCPRAAPRLSPHICPPAAHPRLPQEPGRGGRGHVLQAPAEQLTGEPFPLLLKGTRLSLHPTDYLSLRALTNRRESLPAAGQPRGVGVPYPEP